MSDHIYKKIELVGSSPKSIEEAVVNALDRAQKTIRNMRWFEVVETRGLTSRSPDAGNSPRPSIDTKVAF
jgi:flavin-binding protein dodecin